MSTIKNLGKKELINMIRIVNLRPIDVVKMSNGIIGSNQASQWLLFDKRGKELSKPVFVMLWMMCERLKENLDKTDSGLMENEVCVFDGDDIPEVESSFKGNSFLTDDKINVIEGSFIKKINGYYFNYKGSVYLNETFDNEVCVFEYDGKEKSLRTGTGTFGKYEMIL